MKIGTSEEQRKELVDKENVFDDQHKIVEGKNLFRIVQGPQKIKTIFISTVKEVEEDGVKKVKPTFTAFNFLEDPGILDKAFSVEERIREEMEEEKPEYALQPKTNWFYLAIALSSGSYKVKPLKVPKTVKDDIVKAESELDLKDENFLLNGPYFLYDILVEKTVDAKKGKRYGTSYSAKPYANKFERRIPSSWLNADAGEIIKELTAKEIFDEKMIEAIEACEIDLEKELKPMSVEDIEKKLQKYPINLLGRNKDGKLIYPQVDEFKVRMEALGVPVVEFDFSQKEEIVLSKMVPDVVERRESPLSSMKQSGQVVEEAKIISETPAPAAAAAVESTPAPASTTGSKLRSLKDLTGGK